MIDSCFVYGVPDVRRIAEQLYHGTADLSVYLSVG
jgi:hypothetical protein